MSDEEIEYRELMGDIMRDEREDRRTGCGFWRTLYDALVAVVVLGGLFWALENFARHQHERQCEGAMTGKCGWAWCEHYDGSDYLHDFNF